MDGQNPVEPSCPKKRRWPLILIGVLSACAVALTVEFACRYQMNKLDPEPTFYYGLMTHQQPPLTFGLIPNTVAKEGAYGAEVVMTTNSYGFRYPADPVIPKPPGLTRIFVLGASVAFGLYVMDHETFSSQLELYLKKILGRVEVINAGVPGYLSQDELKMLVFKVLPFEPDIVIIFDGYNDLASNYRPNKEDLTPFGWESDLEKKMQLRQRMSSLSPYRLIYEDAVTYSGIMRMIRRLKSGPPDTATVNEPLEILPEGIALYGRMIRTMAAAARARGSEVIVGFQPNIYYGGAELVAGDLAILLREKMQRPGRIPRFQALTPQYIDEARRAALQTGARFVDLTGVFKGVSADCFLDYAHLTPYGYLIIARRILPEIESILLEKGRIRAADADRVRRLFDESDEQIADRLKGHAGRRMLEVYDPASDTESPYLANVRYHLSKLLPGGDIRIEQNIDALEREPQNWKAHFNLGDILLRKEMFVPAIAHLKEAIGYMPKDTADISPYVTANIHMGYALLRTGNYDSAAGHLAESLKYNPDHVRAHYTLGHVYMEKKNFTEARKHFSEAVRLDPQFAPARINLRKIDQLPGS